MLQAIQMFLQKQLSLLTSNSLKSIILFMLYLLFFNSLKFASLIELQLIIMKKLLLLLLIIFAARTQEDECLTLVSNWIENPQSLSPIVYANSGKFLNDLGDYNNCLFHSDEYIYFTMQVVNRLASMLQNMGLCAPIKCKQQIASNQYAPTIQQQLNTAYKNATGSNFTVFVNLKFYNPQQAQPVFDWSNYLTIGLFGFLVFIGLVGSVIGKVTTSQSLPVKILQSFSIYDNLSKIVAIPTHTENDNLLFLNGTRVLSIFWIVYGHDMWFRFMNIKNWTESIDILTTPGVVTITPAAYFAVDTFFWIGGFLITLGMLEQMKKVKSFITFYFGAVLHRFIRIWPTYMIAILMFWKITPYLGSGPIWRVLYDLSCSCNNGGVLWNVFFIDNFEDHGPNGMDYCFGWGWYLAVDFQLFLITPFFLYAYYKNKKLGWILTFVFFMASVITAFIQILVNDWHYPIPNPRYPPQPDFMDKFYYKPWIRASAYFMGIFSGFIYVEWKNGDVQINKVVNKIKGSVIIRILFYIVGITLVQLTIWIVVPFQTGEEWSTLTQAFYNSLNRVVFLIGVYLCIFAAMFGCKNDPSRIILGHWIFSPLAKVSFCIYLTHFIVIVNGTFSAKSDLYWQVSSALYVIIADIFWSILYATTLSCLIEAPILGLEKIFLRPSKKGDKEQPLIEKAKDLDAYKPLLDSQEIASKEIAESITPQRLQNNTMLL